MAAAAKKITDRDLVIHFLNVGFGDTILIEFPAVPQRDGSTKRYYGLVDCCSAKKVKGYIKRLKAKRPALDPLAFVCATHPHSDHIRGINQILDDEALRPLKFWDSGFRHASQTYRGILRRLREYHVPLIRVSSGMEWYFGTVQVTALAPSVSLRNQYSTYGVNMNNASIVLRVENRSRHGLAIQSQRYTGDRDPEDLREAKQSVVILGADAEFDSWSQINAEYPQVYRRSSHVPLIHKKLNLLGCRVVKVSHHGSMHSAPLDIYERMGPDLAIISTSQTESKKGTGAARSMFPHDSIALVLQEVGARVATTDGKYEGTKLGNRRVRDRPWAHQGSVVVVVPPGGKARWRKLDDTTSVIPKVEDAI